MNDEALAVSDNSEATEPQSDNQAEAKQETLLNPTIEAQDDTPLEDGAVPHTDQPEGEDEAIDWGERPEWIPPQFWSDEDGPDVEGVFKSYNEIRTKMSQGLHKAPKDGEYAMDVMSEAGIEEGDEMVEGYLELAKKHGISQDAFNEIASLYFNSVGEMNDNVQTTIAEEKAKLGRNADKLIAETDRWLTKMGTSGVITQDEMEAIANASTNASFISGINKIRQSYNEMPIPSIDTQEGLSMTRQDLDDMVADPRYGVDKAFTRGVEQKFMQFFGEA